MTKLIEGKLVASLVYLDSGNTEGAKKEIESVIELFEIERLKGNEKNKIVVGRSKGGSGKDGKDKKRRLKKS